MWRPWLSAEVEEQGNPEEINIINEERRDQVEDNEERRDQAEDNEERRDQVEDGEERRSHLTKDAKLLIINLYKKLKTPENSKMEVIRKTAIQLKIPRTTVWRIVTYGVQERKKRIDRGIFRTIDEFDMDVIRRKIYELFAQNISPTVSSLLEYLKTTGCDIVCSESTIKRALKIMGFHYQKLDKRFNIMESQRIRQLRYDYLRHIAMFREEGRFICYLDETWYDTHDLVKKGWVNKNEKAKCTLKDPVSRGKRIIILHCGSENGWTCESLISARNIRSAHVDYHEDMTAELFESWFTTKLIPALPANSVIVMDNARYHSRRQEKIPNSNSKKEEIIKFLCEKNIDFPLKCTKKELLEIMKKEVVDNNEYFVDKYAESNGHTVLRTPPYHCIFNPIELIWAQLKNKIRRNNSRPQLSDIVVNLVKDEISKITADDWKNTIRHVVKIEEYYRSLCTINYDCNLNVSIDESDSN